MTTGEQSRTDDHPLNPEVETWWVGILNGTGGGRNPLQPRIRASLDGETLTVSGAVLSDQELSEVQRDAHLYCDNAVNHIEFSVQVEPDSDGRRGLLRQVLWASFENCEQATLAAGLLRERLPDAILHMAVLEQASDVETSCIPTARAEELRPCLSDGKAVLVIETDETDTFRVNEMLDQDTRSLETTVYPPTVASPGEADSGAT